MQQVKTGQRYGANQWEKTKHLLHKYVAYGDTLAEIMDRPRIGKLIGWRYDPDGNDADDQVYRLEHGSAVYIAAVSIEDEIVNRKIIQVTSYMTSNTTFGIAGIFALCNDGTVWTSNTEDALWKQCNPIPQSEELADV